MTRNTTGSRSTDNRATGDSSRRLTRLMAFGTLALVCLVFGGWQAYRSLNPGSQKLSAEDAAVQAKIDENLRASAPTGGAGSSVPVAKDPTIAPPMMLDPGLSGSGGAQKPSSR